MSDAIGALGARPLARGRAERASGREPARDGEPGAGRSPVAFAALLHASLQPKEAAVKVEGESVAETGAASDAEAVTAETAETAVVLGAPSSTLGLAAAAGEPRNAAEGRGNDGAGEAGEAGDSAALRDTPRLDSPTGTAVHRGTENLVPEMRDRLDRVIERMREEHGHSVTVVETYRSQARQDQLHAQGRTAPGPVVTWTRSSRHTLGRAADVMVNGTYDDPKAYATLQRIAREEGLRTLGARDAGHLELPAQVPGRGTPDGRAAADTLPLSTGARVERAEVSPVTTTPGAKVAAAPPAVAANGVAPVAAVAQVAAVARVARVASVAAPGAARPAAHAGSVEGSGDASRGRGTVQRAVAGTHGRETALAAGGRVAAVETREQRIARLAARAEQEKEAGTEGTLGELLGGTAEEQARGVGGEGRQSAPATAVRAAEPAQGVAGADAIARLDRIEALREGAAARPLSHITLRIDGADGTEDRIRVDLRGNTLGASLELSDAALVERVGARIGELQQALERQGLETEALQVRRGAAAVPEAIETARVASVLLEREAARGAGSQHTGGSASQQHQQHGGSPRDQRDGRPSPDTPSRDQSDPRHRSRREPKGER